MRIQWHPIFAQLLRPLVEDYYEVQTGVPVGDAPREADVVLLRRTSPRPPPFQGLWRWLTAWNVLEFKGPTVSARVGDLDALFELGLGIHRRLGEERAKQHGESVPRHEVTFWYLANHLGRRFLRDAEDLLGKLESLEAGLWRASLLQRPWLLVSADSIPVEQDSVPLHLLSREPAKTRLEVARTVVDNDTLWQLYGGALVNLMPDLAAEVTRMARTKKQPIDFGISGWIKVLGRRRLLEIAGIKETAEEFGLDRLVEEIGTKKLVSKLTRRQREELRRLLAESED